MEVISSSEAVVTTHKTTQRQNPKEQDPQFHGRESHKFQINNLDLGVI
jgi:hypothetical protein